MAGEFQSQIPAPVTEQQTLRVGRLGRTLTATAIVFGGSGLTAGAVAALETLGSGTANAATSGTLNTVGDTQSILMYDSCDTADSVYITNYYGGDVQTVLKAGNIVTSGTAPGNGFGGDWGPDNNAFQGAKVTATFSGNIIPTADHTLTLTIPHLCVAPDSASATATSSASASSSPSPTISFSPSPTIVETSSPIPTSVPPSPSTAPSSTETSVAPPPPVIPHCLPHFVVSGKIESVTTSLNVQINDAKHQLQSPQEDCAYGGITNPQNPQVLKQKHLGAVLTNHLFIMTKQATTTTVWETHIVPATKNQKSHPVKVKVKRTTAPQYAPIKLSDNYAPSTKIYVEQVTKPLPKAKSKAVHHLIHAV